MPCSKLYYLLGQGKMNCPFYIRTCMGGYGAFCSRHVNELNVIELFSGKYVYLISG
ncbi:hypothetical protein Hanom_Chr09g00820721 [Helianthus anomalus]